ncbi:hypothetical protein H2201_005053 [Coniosporium apollinis]|uniref:Uncharacterized protein n=1 Tax=Coniosporium apollinis TaxID=61459 RepID=A0ABQ9NQX7_9PEZI|nr:hypothetical protein H2201_005053 [Coniosporium apollinis]
MGSCRASINCFVPEYLEGPCNQSTLYSYDGSIYDAIAPYVGPWQYNNRFYLRNDTRIFDWSLISELRNNGTLGTVLKKSSEPYCTWVVPFDADPDIAGIGVLLAFLISTWFTLFFVVFAFFFVEGSLPDESPNGLDQLVIRIMTRLKDSIQLISLKALSTTRLGKWIQSRVLDTVGQRPMSLKALRRALVMLTDQQLVTGVAILTIGYIQHCTITQYHALIISSLAWMSFATHETSFIFAVEELHNNSFGKAWRTVWIVVLFFMVSMVQLVNYHVGFAAQFGMPTQCIWGHMRNGCGRQDFDFYFVVVLFLLTLSFLGTMNALYPSHLAWVLALGKPLQWLLRLPSRLHRKARAKSHDNQATPTQRMLWSAVRRFAFGLVVIVFTVSEILFSNIFTIARLYGVLLWGTINVRWAKNSAADGGMSGSESEWGFGQILQVLLLALPLFALLETFTGEVHSSEDQSVTLTDRTGAYLQPPEAKRAEDSEEKLNEEGSATSIPSGETTHTTEPEHMAVWDG